MNTTVYSTSRFCSAPGGRAPSQGTKTPMRLIWMPSGRNTKTSIKTTWGPKLLPLNTLSAQTQPHSHRASESPSAPSVVNFNTKTRNTRLQYTSSTPPLTLTRLQHTSSSCDAFTVLYTTACQVLTPCRGQKDENKKSHGEGTNRSSKLRYIAIKYE